MFKNIVYGIAQYKDTLSLINKLNLWKYFMVPMAISFVFLGGVTALSYAYAGELGSVITGWYPFETGASLILILGKVIAFIVSMLLGLLVLKHVVLALSAPFMSPVSEHMEKALFPDVKTNLAYRNTTNMQQLWRGLRINMRNLILEMIFVLPLLLLSFIPVVGIIFTILSLLVQSYYAGFGNMDYTLERHFSYRDSNKFVKRYRGMAIGNGLVFMLFLFIPVIGVIIVLPFSVVAASKMTLTELIKPEFKVQLSS